MTTTLDPLELIELEEMLNAEPPVCELPAETAANLYGITYLGKGDPCPNEAVEQWRLVCPEHSPADRLWLCEDHIAKVKEGRYVAACGVNRMQWTPAYRSYR